MPPDPLSFDELKLPFIFVPHGEPEPTDWLARHPDYIKLPATFVPRGDGAGQADPSFGSPSPGQRRTIDGLGDAPGTSPEPTAPWPSTGNAKPDAMSAAPNQAPNLAPTMDDPIAAFVQANDALATAASRYAAGPEVSAAANVATDANWAHAAGASDSPRVQTASVEPAAGAASTPTDGSVGDGSITAALAHPSKTLAQNSSRRTRVIFGATAGLYPRSIDPNGRPSDPANWQTDSDAKPIKREAPDSAISAGTATQASPNLADRHLTDFVVRGDGDTRQPWPDLDRYLTVDPSRDDGGKDAPRGNNLYIEFYGTK
jgi:hypothetical protein